MKMIDAIVHTAAGSIIQHGTLNDRVYLLHLAQSDTPTIAKELIHLAQEHGYSKIVCKIPKKNALHFFSSGYLLEGYIPGFYHGKEDAFFVSNFLNPDRRNGMAWDSIRSCSDLLESPCPERPSTPQGDDYHLRALSAQDIASMVGLYGEVFASYPFPITDPAYLLQTMEGQTLYFGAFAQGQLVAIASSEVDWAYRNAEMTDFATQEQHTGHRLAYRLLAAMEEQMKHQGILTLYTIARLHSIPMNKTFLKGGYAYSGTLVNNTHISGGIETMNLYYKSLQ